MSLYLDHAATSPMRPQALEIFNRVALTQANPSSVHGAGRKSRYFVETAREAVLEAVGAHNQRLIFTSGGTEANGLAVHQAKSDLYIGAGEHESLIQSALASSWPMHNLNLQANGQVDLSQLQGMDEGAFVAIQLCNNETGVINDIATAANLVRAKGGWLHVDAVQALGKINIDFDGLGAHSLSLSAHKIGGPQGVGVLIFHRDETVLGLLKGGGQENGLRAGTENVAGIAAFAEAIKVMADKSDLSAEQALVEARLKALGCVIVGEEAPRAPGILAMSQADWSSSLQVIHMDMQNIYISSGSACSSGKVKKSRILEAMGMGALSENSIRISSGWNNQPQDWLRFFEVWSKAYQTHLSRSSNKEVLTCQP